MRQLGWYVTYVLSIIILFALVRVSMVVAFTGSTTGSIHGSGVMPVLMTGSISFTGSTGAIISTGMTMTGITHTGSYSTGIIFTGMLGTGNHSTGSLLTGFLTGTYLTGILPSSPLSAQVQCSGTPPFTIEEISFVGEYTPYIEFVFHEQRSGGFSLSGTALAVPIIIPEQDWLPHTRYLIAQSLHGLHHSDYVITIADFTLQPGTLDISDLSSTFTIQAEFQTGNHVWYTHKGSCDSVLRDGLSPSPGFDIVFLSYLNIQSTPVCPLNPPLTGNTGGINSGSGSLPLTSGMLITGFIPEMQLSFIDFDPPGHDTHNERIGLSVETGNVELSGWSLAYDTKIYQFGSGEVVAGTDYIRKSNFQFSNSRATCVRLFYTDILRDELCYDPRQHTSPHARIVLSSGSSSFTGLSFKIVGVVYDPPGQDTNNESITIQMLAGSGSIDMSQFRIRIGTKTKTISGTMSSGDTYIFTGTFQMPNNQSICVALTHQDTIYDEYCYTILPKTLAPSVVPDSQKPVLTLQTGMITIAELVHDPQGPDANNESITLSVPDELLLTHPLILHINNKKKKLTDPIRLSGRPTRTGSFGFPNTEDTCVELYHHHQKLDTRCYTPETHSGVVEDVVEDNQIDLDLYSGMLLIDSLLPNPYGKDVKGEYLTFTWNGHSGHLMDNLWKVKIGKRFISLSGTILISGEQKIILPTSLPNTPQCIELYYHKQRIDVICYPQPKEGVVYYHERTGRTGSLSSELHDRLQANDLLLSKLILKKQNNQVCLMYEGQIIRCTKAISISKTTTKNRLLLKLYTAYITKVNELYYQKQLHTTTIHQWTQAYQHLLRHIKDHGDQPLTIYGTTIAPTELDRYVQLVYAQDPEDYVMDWIGHSLIGSDQMAEYYDQLYHR